MSGQLWRGRAVSQGRLQTLELWQIPGCLQKKEQQPWLLLECDFQSTSEPFIVVSGVFSMKLGINLLLSPLLSEHGQFKAHELVPFSSSPTNQTIKHPWQHPGFFLKGGSGFGAGCSCWVPLSSCSVTASAHLGMVVTAVSHWHSQGQDPREGLELFQGGFRLDLGKGFGVLGAGALPQAPQGMGTFPRLPELQEC